MQTTVHDNNSQTIEVDARKPADHDADTELNQEGQDDVILYEYDTSEMDNDTELRTDQNLAQVHNAQINVKNAAKNHVTINRLTFTDLRGTSISASAAHAYVKGYNLLISKNPALKLKILTALYRHPTSYIIVNYRKSSRPAETNKVCNGIYSLLLINPHLKGQLTVVKRLLHK